MGVLAGMMLCCTALAKPPVFTEKGYVDALAEAAAVKRLVIIKGTAEWCPPCKEMNRTTWLDAELVKWIGDHAVAVYLDVDKEPQRAEALNIRAMPTIIVLKDGKEFDRVVGYQSAAQMKEWLEAVHRGESRTEALRKKAGERVGPDGKVDVRARMNLARELSQSQAKEDLDKAADEYVWLWKNMLQHQASMLGVRSSFMAGDMKRLAEKHPNAKVAFVALRDEAEQRLKTEPTFEDLQDWVVLNLRVLDDEAPVLAWFDRNKDKPDFAASAQRVDRDLSPLLLKHERWADAGRILSNVDFTTTMTLNSAVEVSRSLSRLEGVGDDPRKRANVEAAIQQSMRKIADDLAASHAALLAAGRQTDAWRIVDRSLAAVEKPAAGITPAMMRTALAETALRAKVVTPKHIEMLTGPGAEGVDRGLIERLRGAVEAGAKEPGK
jgi:thioredoxin 1